MWSSGGAERADSHRRTLETWSARGPRSLARGPPGVLIDELFQSLGRDAWASLCDDLLDGGGLTLRSLDDGGRCGVFGVRNESVRLYRSPPRWHCSAFVCRNLATPCEHVVAAALAWRAFPGARSFDLGEDPTAEQRTALQNEMQRQERTFTAWHLADQLEAATGELHDEFPIGTLGDGPWTAPQFAWALNLKFEAQDAMDLASHPPDEGDEVVVVGRRLTDADWKILWDHVAGFEPGDTLYIYSQEMFLTEALSGVDLFEDATVARALAQAWDARGDGLQHQRVPRCP